MPLTLNSLTLDEVQAIIDGLETDIAALQAEDLVFDNNIRGFAIIDMGADNYTMTLDEANASIKVITNTGVAKTLTWPTTSDDTAPSTQFILMALTVNGVFLESESGGASTFIGSEQSSDIKYMAGSAPLLLSAGYGDISRKMHNGLLEITDAAYSPESGSEGVTFRFNRATGQTITIEPFSSSPPYDWSDNSIFYGVALGAGAVTVVAGVGVTLIMPDPVMTVGRNYTFRRDDSTDTWLVS